MLPSELTAGEVAARLGVKSGMVRRYALALETVTGISLEVDPVRGRLYPVPVVETLEAARAYLLAHPGASVEGALRAVTGQGEGAVSPPARVPGSLSGEDLRAALGGLLAEAQAPVLAALEDERERGRVMHGQLSELSSELRELRGELAAARASVERLEVMTRAALPEAQAPASRPEPRGVLGVLAHLLGLTGR